MSKDDFKKHIKGFRNRGHGVCPCCREAPKKTATRMARRRLKHEDRIQWILKETS